MNARIGWTLSAVALVIFFIAARFIVGSAIEESTGPTPQTRSLETGPPAPMPAPPPRPVDPLDPLHDIVGMVMAVEESGGDDPEALKAAHEALDKVETLEIEWTDDRTMKASKLFERLEARLSDMEGIDDKLTNHVLAARIALAAKTGHPNADAEAELEKRRKENPEHFEW